MTMAVPQGEGLAVVCRAVTKEFRQGSVIVRALRGVDVEVRMGELTLLMGPSGCGKTTLLSVMAGILDPTSGSINVLGSDIERLTSRQKTAFRMKNIGFVFQMHNLLPALSAMENTAVPLLIARRPRNAALAAARQLLEGVGLGERVDALPSRLSGGEQQRVAIARALVHRPRLLVCDEPTSALDAKSGHAIMQQLRDIAVEPDRAVVVVTHDPRVIEFADRIATMDDGRITDVRETKA
ncbi:MAG: ABC transporter ATP-binding protein [Planctomycetales bacterium]|nr:ABC transporter ATP-binding protein [Planctomycetales bacterium]